MGTLAGGAHFLFIPDQNQLASLERLRESEFVHCLPKSKR